MKLAVYGDSFGVGISINAHFNWYDVLAKKLGLEKIDNYSLPGTSLYYSYKEFLKTHHKYDKIIFLVTGTDRFPTPVSFSNGKIKHGVTGLVHINSLRTSRTTYECDITDEDMITLDKLESWFSLLDEEHEKTMFSLMLDDIERLHNDVILYPNFITSFTLARFDKHGIPIDKTMSDIHNEQLKKLNLLNSNIIEKTTCGHMIPEYNHFFANLMYNKIVNNKWDYTGLDDIKIEHPADYYYEIKT
jgi:hypothetical protein